jgi:hypothetical protein
MSARAVFSWARLLAPLILANIPQTRPIAVRIGDLMDEAESLTGTPGPEKLQHVTRAARQVGDMVNLTKPGAVNLDHLDAAVQSGIDTAFEAARAIEKDHGSPAAPIAALPLPELGTLGENERMSASGPLTPESTHGYSFVPGEGEGTVSQSAVVVEESEEHEEHSRTGTRRSRR